MISVSEALKHIETFCKHLEIVKKPIAKTLGLVLAEDVFSPINMPPFKQSSMDGYAFMHSDKLTYKLVGEVQAGNSEQLSLNPGEAVRIFTGAKVPDDADTVVMQEHVVRTENTIHIEKLPQKLANVRELGEQVKEGDLALEKDTVLHEAAIGFLAGLGIESVNVYRRPKVSILITGNELQTMGNALKGGQVYDSNSVTLKLALKRVGIKDVKLYQVEDNLKSTTNAIQKCLKNSDVLIISGGISVGDYDFVKQSLVANSVTEVFYKVNQKPGKPLWFGHKKDKFVFALPGNPASSLSCFYNYVLPLLKAQIGYKNYHLPKYEAIATEDIKNNFSKTLFLKGNVVNGNATVLSGQASSMLKSFAVSNALLIVPEEIVCIKKGMTIKYLPL